MMVACDEMWMGRAALCEFLALSFRYPERELAEAVSSGEWLDAARELADVLGLGLPEGFGDGLPAPGNAAAGDAGSRAAGAGDDAHGAGASRSAGSDACASEGDAGADARATAADEMLRSLRPEATRLLVGAPRAAVPPYEGVARAEAEGVQPLLFVSPHALEVERFCRACGLGRPAGTNEPLDHVVTELELLQYLATRAAVEQLGEATSTSEDASVPTSGNGAASTSGDEADSEVGGEGAPAAGGVGTSAIEGAGAADSLPGGSPQAAYELFLENHAGAWMPGFAERVAAEARHPLYVAAARLLAAFVS